jgi:wyosine [tRNA(Phe)-imidazoG37] synthetase (radical SAM superfamily)
MGAPEDIALLDKTLSELIIKYEQYFLGTEKREPQKLLAEVEQLIRRYQNTKIINSMVNFRYNTLVAKFNSYRQNWHRIVRLIEEGKYYRDQFKAKMHEHEHDSQRPRTREPQRQDSELDSVYKQFMDARKACAMPTENVSREMIAAALEKQKPAIMNKYGCKNVEFKVVVENGQPKIKARPK